MCVYTLVEEGGGGGGGEGEEEEHNRSRMPAIMSHFIILCAGGPQSGPSVQPHTPLSEVSMGAV